MKECNCHRGPEVGKKVIGCPPKVININHPQEPVLFHRVDVPAIMGDDVTYPPENGLYKNVLLVYEANNHTYLYNSDGIPTSLTVNTSELEEALEDLDIRLDQETETRLETDIALREDIDQVAEDLEEFKNSPDVVDIVSTYADLQAYDTSALGDKDVIRVLADETHDDASTYYRWDKPNTTWIYIGVTGPYYTKTETDTLIDGSKRTWIGTETTSSSSGATAEITTTTEDFEWAEGHTVVVNFKYKAGRSALNIDSTGAYNIDNVRSLAGGIDGSVAIQYVCVYVGGQRGYRPIGRLRASSDVAGPVFIADNLTTTGSMLTALSANQGKTLNDKIIDNVGMARVLTADDYNWNSTSSSATAPYDSIALWLLPSGQYQINDNSMKVFTSISATELTYPYQHMYLINKEPDANASILVTPYSAAAVNTKITFYVTSAINGQPSGGTTVNGMTIPWGDIPTVVQDTGASTTNVMSQKAVRDLIFNASFNPDEKNNIRIGYNAASYNNSVAIGNQANSGRINTSAVVIGNRAVAGPSTSYAIAIGEDTNAGGNGSICIGKNTSNPNKGCIMLGAYCSNYTSNDGVMYIGTTNTDYGYNNSNYRLLTGLYDPQSTHDAATKGYVDNAIAAKIISSGASAPSTSTVGEVGTLCTYVTSGTGHLAICTEVNAGTPTTYTWQTLI